MPRQRRICVPGMPMHIVQRGNNRQSCFLHAGDYHSYLKLLGQAADRYDTAIHAYALMTNHVHLLVTPNHASSASSVMQHLGRGYVLRFNRIHNRTGTLWEGRFRSSIIDTEKYLFACYRYIELNPVRAGIVSTPEKYRWSSYRINAQGARTDLILPRDEWLDLGRSRRERCARYRRMFGSQCDEEVFSELRTAVR